jgi:hypothetical protein
MGHRLAIQLKCGLTARLNTRADMQINVVILAGCALNQRVVYSICGPITAFAAHVAGLYVGNAFIELTDAEASAVFGFLGLAGWKA